MILGLFRDGGSGGLAMLVFVALVVIAGVVVSVWG
jgi:hypothetical protein